MRVRVVAAVVALAAAFVGVTSASHATTNVCTTRPQNVSPPTIGGTAVLGATITTTSNGAWCGSTPMTFSYQWVHCDPSLAHCWNIAGATHSSYTLGLNDVTRVVRVVVTASNESGSGGSPPSDPSAVVQPDAAHQDERFEQFDDGPDTWSGHNAGPAPEHPASTYTVKNSFGWSQSLGQVGGMFGRGKKLATYGQILDPQAGPYNQSSSLTATGKFTIRSYTTGDTTDNGGVVIGFYNSATTEWWRSADTIALRLDANGTSDFAACIDAASTHYAASLMKPGHCTASDSGCASDHWTGRLVSNTAYVWSLTYDPSGNGSVTLALKQGATDLGFCTVALSALEHTDGFTVDRFGVMPEMRGGVAGQMIAYIDDVSVNNGPVQTFTTSPTDLTGTVPGKWTPAGARASTWTDEPENPPTGPLGAPDQAPPNFASYDSFGWAGTALASGEAGEVGGLIWRPNVTLTTSPSWYADSVSTLDLTRPLHAEGYVTLTYANTDSGSLFGWFNPSTLSQGEYPADFVGFAIEGRSEAGYPVRPIVHGAAGTAVHLDPRGSWTSVVRLDPNASRHHFTMDYTPTADGGCTLDVSLDGQDAVIQLTADQFAAQDASGTMLTKFGMTQYSDVEDGPSQTVYYDSLIYTDQ